MLECVIPELRQIYTCHLSFIYMKEIHIYNYSA